MKRASKSQYQAKNAHIYTEFLLPKHMQRTGKKKTIGTHGETICNYL